MDTNQQQQPAQASKSQRMATVNTLLDGYGSLSVPRLLEPLAQNFEHHVLPESLAMPPRNKESFAHHAAGIFGVFDEFRMVPQSMVDDGASGVVVVHAHMQGVLKGGKGVWTNECIMMITLSDDGTQVVGVKEFVDSAKAMEMARKHKPKDFEAPTTNLGSEGPELGVVS
ncbi:Uu.00g079270.m01.CDS01 [Anthostomella pinea]|uniref:Uu.00g079270.m01.CDS01 n=1 Tax=Anthostomella pinea TaxID=933095 RepID=A0AAI8VKR8_9PEZI|nr:Uu.00g079270.m01.CDS01 [Anthostomella pinea]